MRHGHDTVEITHPKQLVILARDRFPAAVQQAARHLWSHRHEDRDAGQVHVVLDLPHTAPAGAQQAVEEGLHAWRRTWDDLEGQQRYLLIWAARVQRAPGAVLGMGSRFQIHLDLQYQHLVQAIG
ncbi:hypothetical protein ACTOB_003774 [Actinoplanes oblitus]|uniref:Uncharacterized protein n=1 Tax=Actinoplanes oblitus TaxID=3040509 RepID=A0ABY8WTF7_9ACTN|nr:hypothetical protein [Actinoplanes oblitus]WIN00093.1 hypothetical protein ACTOB_003774 [Actinoplanes oblitus]